jgi:urease accessory protein
MQRVTEIKPKTAWTGRPAETVILDYDERHRRRIVLTSVKGLNVLLDLAEATVLRNGDALVLEDGRLVEVVAAPEPLVEVKCADARTALRLAWHLGNRHLPVEITSRALRIRQDHVIEEMLRGLGATLRRIEAPFDPEGGAYAEAGIAGHGHQAAHDHHHAGHHGHHDHDRSHGHAHDH